MTFAWKVKKFKDIFDLVIHSKTLISHGITKHSVQMVLQASFRIA